MNPDQKIDVGYVATLARLELDETSRKKLQSDMENIVGYVNQLNELNIAGIEPTAHPSPMKNVWREDASKNSFPREKMLENAPELIDGELVKVPQVIPGTEEP